jgi:hypothetical protein
MAIDTQDKRRSALGGGISFLTIFQDPDSAISSFDRRHQESFYRGITTFTRARFMWISEKDTSSNYRCETNSASTYRCEANSAIVSKDTTETDNG